LDAATQNWNRLRWREAVQDPSSPRALPLASVRMTATRPLTQFEKAVNAIAMKKLARVGLSI